jgi:hypothetical protein
VKFRVVCLDGDLMPITNEMDITIIVSKLNNIQLWPSGNASIHEIEKKLFPEAKLITVYFLFGPNAV